MQTTIFRNMASLGLLQAANYVIPVLIIPFVVRALGAESFGNVSYVQNIISYLTILVNYGFEYSATRAIALCKGNKNEQKNVFWTIIYYKLLLFVVSSMILCALFFLWPRVQVDIVLFMYAFLINIGFVLFPNWFFQGIEEMGKMACFNFLIKFLGGICVVIFVRNATDDGLYLLLLSLSYIVVGLFAFIYVVLHYDLGRGMRGVVIQKKLFSISTPIFFNTLCGTVYSTFGLTYLGFYANNTDLGIYSGAYKIIIAFIMLVNFPISMSLFPAMARKFSVSKAVGWAFFKKSIFYVTLFACLLCVVIFVSSPIIVPSFLGSEFVTAVPLLRFFSILPLLVIVASMFTIQGLYAFQLECYAPYVGLMVMCICICVTVVLVPRWGIFGAACGYLIAEIAEIVLSGSLVYFKRE